MRQKEREERERKLVRDQAEHENMLKDRFQRVITIARRILN